MKDKKTCKWDSKRAYRITNKETCHGEVIPYEENKFDSFRYYPACKPNASSLENNYKKCPYCNKTVEYYED